MPYSSVVSGLLHYDIFRRNAAPGYRLPGAPAARPGPLEIVAAEPAGDVDRLADHVEARNPARLHGLGRQLPGIDSAERHLGFRPSLRAGRADLPALEARREIRKRAVRDIGERSRRQAGFGERLPQARR